MSTLKLSGDVSGYAELRTNSAAGTVIVTMPLVSGNLIVSPLGTPANPANGQVLIGNTVSGGYDLNTLTQGTGIVITNTKGTIEISATGGSATDQYARDKANGAVQTGFPTIVVATQSDIVADSNTDTLTVVAGSGIAVTTDAGTDTLTITHPTSGVSATGYGDAATIPVFVVDARGHLTSVTNTAIAISATQITSGTLAVVRGGTGQTAITVNGSLLIGNTVSGGFDVNPITQGTNITITNDKGSITIASSDAFAQSQANAAYDRANAAYANANTAIYTAAQIRANISNTAPIRYDATTGIVSHADSGVTPSGYGDAATIPVFVANATGHISSVVNTAIAISATQITSGTLAVARGGTAQTAINGNGSLLIGNTVSGGYDVNTLTQGTNITITNDKGAITIAATGGGGPGFGDIQISGQGSVVADQANDVLTLVAGTGVTLTTDAGTDTITLSAADAFASAQANAAFNAANAASTLGLHTMWIPAWAMYPQLTNGASAANGLFEMTTNLQMLKTLDFDTTTAENAQFAISMPNSWDEGTITANAVWSHNVTTVNFGVTWTLEGRAYSDNEAIDQAFGTPVPTSDTGGTANTVYITPPTSAITIAGTPTAGDWIIFRVSRQVANASDTMAIDARLHGVQIKYTTAASTEA